MVQDESQPGTPVSTTSKDEVGGGTGSLAVKPAPGFRQAVSGLTPPQQGEAGIRENWPALPGVLAGPAALGKRLIRSIVFAPLGWLVLAPVFALKFTPFICRRYTLTNRRLMIQKGLKPAPVGEIALQDIEEVRIAEGSYDSYYHAATLEVVSQGKVALTLPGVPEPEGFRHAVLNAVRAWAPGRLKEPHLPASAVK
jgi:hypothetical protein